MSKSKQEFGVGSHSLVALVGIVVALSTLLTMTACSATGSAPTAGGALETGGAPPLGASREPGSPADREPAGLDASVRAFIASEQAKPRPDVSALNAHPEQVQTVASTSQTPAFEASNNVLDLPVPPSLTIYPQGATDGFGATPVPIVSSSASSIFDGRWPTTATYDGDMTSFWMTAGNTADGGKDYMPWIQYTFDQVYSVGTLRVSNYNGGEYRRGAKDVEVLVSQDGTTFTSLGYKQISIGSSTTTGGTWQSFDLGGARAKSVKLAIHTNYYGGSFYGLPTLEVPWANASITGLSEVQFYAALPIVSSSASSIYDGRWPTTASYDGDVATFWMTAGNSLNEGKDYRPWIQYTFDQVYSLGTMRVINFDGYEYLRGAKDVEVLVSQDGTTFTSLGYQRFLLGSSTTIDGTLIAPGATWQSFDLGGVHAKSVKLAIHTNYYGWTFYGSPDLDGGTGGFANGSITGLREVQFYAPIGDNPLVQDFNQLGPNATASLPAGWRIDSQAAPNVIGTYAAAVSQTTQVAGASLDPNAENGIYNFGAGVANSQAASYWLNSIDRAPGWLSAGSALTTGGTKSGNLYVALRAPSDRDLTGIFVGYDVEKYKQGTNPSGFRVQLFSSTDGANWTNAGNSFLSQFAPDSSNAGYDPAPGNTVTVSPTRLSASILRGTAYYLAWNYTLNSSSAVDGGNGQAIGIDNVSLKGEAPPACVKQCSGKVCGGNLDDGCGGVCPAACTTGQIGCAANADCAPGSICTNRSPDPAAPRLCVPILCGPTCSATCPCSGGATCLAPSECASNFSCEQSVCACQPSCAGKACGAPDGCGGVCNDGCGPGDTCQPGGCLAGLTCSPMGGTSGSPSTSTNVCMALGLPRPPPKQRPYTTLPSDADALLPSASSGQLAPGRLAGTSSVDSAGAFSYRVPIEVSPGRAGMEPHLAFSYSSSGGNGLLGVGWNLEGTSSIARCRKVVAREGVPDSVKVKVKASCAPGAICPEQSQQYNDAIDNFCLDGQKLVRVGGTPTSPEFRTERDSFAKIVATYGGNNWPSKFMVWNRDGTIATYLEGIVGTGVASRDTATGEPNGRSFSSVLAWPIESLQDRFGNGVLYSYDAADQGSAAQVLKTIQYTTCSTGSACAASSYDSATRIVRLNYEPRPDYLSHWVAGLNAGIALRLRSINVSTGSAVDETLVRSYNLGYDTSGATARSRLTSILPCGATFGCLSPTTFQWGTGQGQDFRNTWHVWGPDAGGTVVPGQCTPSNPAPGCYHADYTSLDLETSPDSRNPFLIGDFDGNGTDDILALSGDLTNADESSHSTGYLDLSHASGNSLSFEQINIRSGGTVNQDEGPDWEGARAVDIDQDGQTEVLVRDEVLSAGDGHENVLVQDFKVYRYNAAIHDFAQVFLANGAPLLLGTPSDIAPLGAPAMFDMNGDGVLDYLYDTGSLQADGHSHFYNLARARLGLGTLLPDSYTVAFPLSYSPAPADQALFDQGRCQLQPIDYAGHGYNSPAVACNDANTATFFSDMNGDGLADILKINHGTQASVSVRLSSGVELVADLPNSGQVVAVPESQALPSRPLAATEFTSPAQTSFADKILHNRVLDMNGDGLADIVQFQTQTLTEAPAVWLSQNSDAVTPTLARIKLPYSRRRVADIDQQVGDFNGDGLPDLVLGVDLVVDHNDSVKLQFLMQDPSNRDDVITKVTSDSAELASLTYQAGPTEKLGPDGTDPVAPVAGVFTPRRGLNVVKKATLVEGATRSYYSYYYQQPAADTFGRGFLGFGTIVKADWQRGTKILSTYDNTRMEGTLQGYHLFPYALTPSQVYTETDSQALAHLQVDGPAPLSDILVTRSEYSTFAPRIHPLNSVDGTLGPTTTYFIEDTASSILKQDESGNPYYTGNAYRFYDDFGNLTDSTLDDGPEETSVHSNFNNDSSSKWRVSQLQDSTTRVVRNDPAVPSATQTTTPHLVRYTYGDNGELRTVTDTPNGWRTQTFTVLTRDSAGLVRSEDVTDAFGNERGSSFDYSDDGVYKEHTQDALGHDTWIGYHDGLGVPLISFDANGNETLYRYDGFGHPRAIVPTRAATTNITYEQGAGAMTITTQQSPGTTVLKQYTDLGKVAYIHTNISGNISVLEYTWDNLGRLREQQTPRFIDQPTRSLLPTVYAYDNLNNVRSVTNPDGSTVSVKLLDGLTTETITSSSDDKTHDVVVRKTEDGLVASVREDSSSDAISTRGVDYVYGQGKQLVQVTELGGPTTTYYSYGQPKPTYVISSESGTTSLLYDGFGNPQSIIHDPSFPSREDYEFDSLGRLTLLSATTPDAARPGQTTSERTSYIYDVGQGAIGKLSSSSSPDGVATRYTYTPEGLLTEKDYDSGPDTFRVGYHRDPYGRVDHVDYPETGQARFGVDLSFNDIASDPEQDGSLSAVSRSGVNYWSTRARGPTGMAESVLLGSDAIEFTNVNPVTRRIESINVADVTGRAAYNVEYGYYLGGNVKTRADTVAGTIDSYEYDAYDQLSKWSFSGPGGARAESYAYDVLGNQTSTGKFAKTFGGDGYSPHQLAKEVEKLDISRYKYDPLGRQTSWSQNLETQRTVTYTPFDLPRSITTTQPTTRTINYAYDADQHKFSESDGAATTTYIDDLYERRVDNATGVTKHIFYVFADGKRIAQVVQSGASETTTRLYSDLTGSVTGSDQGAPASRQAFSPWGERLSLSTTSLTSQIANVTTGFSGQEHDDSVGLINMRGRVYDPVTRTFLTPDPILGSLKVGGWNKYAYVLNNPLKFTDPSGFAGDATEDDPSAADIAASDPGNNIFAAVVPVQSPPPPDVSPTSPDGGSRVDPGQSTDSTTQSASIENEGGLPLDSFSSTSSDNGAEGGPNPGGPPASHPSNPTGSLMDLALGAGAGLLQFATQDRGVVDKLKEAGLSDKAIASLIQPPPSVPGIAAAVGVPLALTDGASLENLAAEGAESLAFSQTTASAAFSAEGDFAGKTIGGLAGELRSGAVAASDVPVKFVNIGGNSLIVNTRSSLALMRAGMPQSGWTLINGTATDAASIEARLLSNGLTVEGTSTLRITGLGSGASSLR